MPIEISIWTVLNAVAVAAIETFDISHFNSVVVGRVLAATQHNTSNQVRLMKHLTALFIVA